MRGNRGATQPYTTREGCRTPKNGITGAGGTKGDKDGGGANKHRDKTGGRLRVGEGKTRKVVRLSGSTCRSIRHMTLVGAVET